MTGEATDSSDPSCIRASGALLIKSDAPEESSAPEALALM